MPTDNLDISSDVIRGYIDPMILRILLEGPSYGYQISKRVLQMSGGLYAVKQTTLYSAFARMERNGLVQSFPQVAQNGKRRTYYRMTAAGMTHYRQKCREWQLTKDVVGRFLEGSVE